MDAGVDAKVAYTVEKRIHAMTSKTVAEYLQPVLAELREMRENMVTKADLANFATKADLAESNTRIATKAAWADVITKADLASFETRLTGWLAGALLVHAVLTVTLIVGFMSVMR